MALPAVLKEAGLEPGAKTSGRERHDISYPEQPLLARAAVDTHVSIAEFHHISKDFRIVLQPFLSNDSEPASFRRRDHFSGYFAKTDRRPDPA